MSSLIRSRFLSIGTGNAPFELQRKGVFGGLIAWKEAIKAAMFLTTDNATAQAKLLFGPDRCLRIEPEEVDSSIDLDDYDRACARRTERRVIERGKVFLHGATCLCGVTFLAPLGARNRALLVGIRHTLAATAQNLRRLAKLAAKPPPIAALCPG